MCMGCGGTVQCETAQEGSIIREVLSAHPKPQTAGRETISSTIYLQLPVILKTVYNTTKLNT